MRGQTLLIGILLPVLAGCFSYSRPLGYTNASITDTKQGQDCRFLLFGLGGSPDVTMNQSMLLGGMTKLRSAEYRVDTFQGTGHDCVITHGE